MNVSEPIRRNAQLEPDAAAYRRADGTCTSYAELEKTIDALIRHRLRHAEVRSDYARLHAPMDPDPRADVARAARRRPGPFRGSGIDARFVGPAAHALGPRGGARARPRCEEDGFVVRDRADRVHVDFADRSPESARGAARCRRVLRDPDDPHDLEDALRELAGLREVAVFSATVGAGTRALCAAIVSNVPLDADTFHARCREHLCGKAPELIIHLRELPRNAAVKVMRGELEGLLLAGLRARRAMQ